MAGRWKRLVERFPEAERPVADGDLGRDRKPAGLQIDEQFLPALRALAHARRQAEQLLLALRRGADDHQYAFGLWLHPRLQINAVGPDIHIAPRRQVALLPALYLRGISAGDFQEVLTALLGKDAPNLSPAVLARLKGEWEDEYRRWQARDLSARRYVYVWADGVYLQARMEPQAECMLVLIGATPEGRKELIGFQTGARESAQSWKELLVDLKARGLCIAPEIAVGDGALGFWKALDEAFPSTRHQRCWVHKTLNVLDKLPRSVQPNAHKDLREIWLSSDRASADFAITTFAEKYAPKYDKAVDCLLKDRDALLTFFDFPAEHWAHLRTSNPIESVFATVRHRTVRMKGALSQDTARLMVFKLVMAASKSWRRLQGQNQLPKIIAGVTFRDGIEVAREDKAAA